MDELLAIHGKLPAAASPPQLPHRIEHAQHLSGSNATQLLSRLGLHAVTNPQHLLTDRGIMLEQLGAERSRHGRSFAYSSMQKVWPRGSTTKVLAKRMLKYYRISK